jgi:hypothetical protein|uniref:Uncharacterized protein n=1 Tax=Siphoviridae sp. ctMsr1 TaxID=2826264 RepID=A0A8S5LUS2_9CAUD|nr:MAG TPA: hypothetical protein [Siphoviridae sp. ctMsr1]
MSSWTYVQGLIELDVPGRTQAEKNYILQTVIDHLPKVTGSEKSMNIYTIQTAGHDSWQNFDEFYNRVEDFRTQSRYFLVLDGNLRDRHYKDTFKELNKFLNRLGKRLMVDSVYVRLYNYEHSHIFTNKNDCYGKMFENEDPWYNYLMWEFEDED